MKEKHVKQNNRAAISPELVARAKAGDQDAFTELYQLTNVELYRSIHSMVRDENLAWDIQQDCYLRAFRSLDTLEANEAFLSWLRRIAVNVTAKTLSRRLPTTFSELSDSENDALFDLPDPHVETQPELSLDQQETTRLVREILAGLSEGQQMILGMHYYEDLSVNEIAKLLNLTAGTVKTQLYRGRKKVEAEVRALEQQGLKLYGLSPLAFALALMKQQQPAAGAQAAAMKTVLAQTTELGSKSVALTAKPMGTHFFLTAAGKLTAGLLGLALTGTAALGIVSLSRADSATRGDYHPTESLYRLANTNPTESTSATPLQGARQPVSTLSVEELREQMGTKPALVMQSAERWFYFDGIDRIEESDQYQARLCIADPVMISEQELAQIRNTGSFEWEGKHYLYLSAEEAANWQGASISGGVNGFIRNQSAPNEGYWIEQEGDQYFFLYAVGGQGSRLNRSSYEWMLLDSETPIVTPQEGTTLGAYGSVSTDTIAYPVFDADSGALSIHVDKSMSATPYVDELQGARQPVSTLSVEELREQMGTKPSLARGQNTERWFYFDGIDRIEESDQYQAKLCIADPLMISEQELAQIRNTGSFEWEGKHYLYLSAEVAPKWQETSISGGVNGLIRNQSEPNEYYWIEQEGDQYFFIYCMGGLGSRLNRSSYEWMLLDSETPIVTTLVMPQERTTLGAYGSVSSNTIAYPVFDADSGAFSIEVDPR